MIRQPRRSPLRAVHIRAKRLPNAPGVYFFLGRNRKIFYIGRATSLRNRVRSYFASDIAEQRSQWIEKMIGEATSVDFKKTDSVLEAILLEADLIRRFKPPYNTELKDDKSFNCVAITKEDFPRLLVARQRDADLTQTSRRPTRKGASEFSAVYGPFPNGLELKHAIKIIRRIFPYRDSNCTPCIRQRSSAYRLRVSAGCKPCFSRQVGLCPGVCTGEMSREEYAKTIRNLRLFFEGKKTRLVKLLQREMKTAAQSQEFEKAHELKKTIFALQHIQDVALFQRDADVRRFEFEGADKRGYASQSASIRGNISDHQRFRVEAYDLSHFGGTDIVGAMTVVENGRAVPSEYRLFKIRGLHGANEPAGMQEIIRRRLNHPEWPFPSLIVVDGGEIQKRAADEVLLDAKLSIPVVAVVKDERHRPVRCAGDHALISRYKSEILLANSEAHRFALGYHRRARRKRAVDFQI